MPSSTKRAWNREEVIAIISEKLAQFVGPTMAIHATRMHCDKVAQGTAPLDSIDIDHLLSSLAPGLRVFIGEAKTKEAFFHVHCALDLAGGKK